jgi:acyl-CoA reductase-like NAD-dependent aldehyde dehydrogenase
MVPMWMFANAIMCGNTFILKPSEKDPSASNYLAALLKEAGVPDGVFNVVHGDRIAVDSILAHPDVKAVSFVGSTPIAKAIYETGTKHGKRVQALGGAKNHMLVLPDADLDMAADAAVSAAYGSAGERCMAISVVLAVGDVGDALVAKIRERLPKINVGPGSDPKAEMGPLVTREHRDKVAGYLQSGKDQGATLVADGREHPLYHPTDGGYFLGVSLMDHVDPSMDSYRNEIFGPVLQVVRSSSSTRTRTATGRRSSPGTAAPRGASSSRSRSAWSASTCRSRSPSRTTRSAAGRARSSATSTCTGLRGSPSIPAARSSRRAGPTRARARSISASPGPADRVRPPRQAAVPA